MTSMPVSACRAHDVGYRACDARVEGGAVVGLAHLLLVEERNQIGRARQAAGVGREDAALAALHHSTLRLSFLISADQRVMSRSTIARIFFRRARHRFAAVGGDPLLNLGIGDRDAHRLVDLVDDRLRRAGGRQQAVVEHHVEAGEPRFRHRRHVRQERRTLRARHRQRAQIARLDIAERRRDRSERCLHVAAHEIGDELAVPL